jgi:hypothetical protein
MGPKSSNQSDFADLSRRGFLAASRDVSIKKKCARANCSPGRTDES